MLLFFIAPHQNLQDLMRKATRSFPKLSYEKVIIKILTNEIGLMILIYFFQLIQNENSKFKTYY